MTRAAGQGLTAVFQSPGRVLRCASEIVASVGQAARGGVHIGECVIDSGVLRGDVVEIASSLAEQSSAGEVLITRTVLEVSGSGQLPSATGTRTLHLCDRSVEAVVVTSARQEDET